MNQLYIETETEEYKRSRDPKEVIVYMTPKGRWFFLDTITRSMYQSKQAIDRAAESMGFTTSIWKHSA